MNSSIFGTGIFYQVISRPRSTGKTPLPYRLILIYDSNGKVEQALEVRSASSETVHELRRSTLIELPEIRAEASSYNDLKKKYEEVLENTI